MLVISGKRVGITQRDSLYREEQRGMSGALGNTDIQEMVRGSRTNEQNKSKMKGRGPEKNVLKAASLSKQAQKSRIKAPGQVSELTPGWIMG